MTGLPVRALGICAIVMAGTAALSPSLGQWTSDKPPVLKPSDYPPLATEDPPDPPKGKARHQAPADGQDNSNDSANGADAPPPGSYSRGGVETGNLPAPGPAQLGAPQPLGPRIAPPAPVQVDTLGRPEGPAVGTLDAQHGGYGENLWASSERGQIEGLLTKAPLATPDPVLRDITRRLILSKAPPPPGNAQRAFVSVRLEQLLEAGFTGEAGALAAAAEVPKDEDFARVQAHAILLANRSQDVCGKATQTRNDAGDPFWLRLRTMCAALSGDTATADLTREVLKAQGHPAPAFDALLDGAVHNKPVAPGAIGSPDVLHLYLLQRNGLPVTEAIARKISDPLDMVAANLLVVRDRRNTPQARFEAAERVVLSGALSASELRSLAEEQELPLGRVAGAADEAPKLPYFMGQVLLRRAASIESRPENKARLLAIALSLGESKHALALTAMLQGDVLASVKPGPATQIYAKRFAQALILSRRYEAASAWAANNASLRAAIAVASQEPVRLGNAQADFSMLAQSLNDPGGNGAYKTLVLGLADALGLALPPDAKAAAAQPQNWNGARPPAAETDKLRAAAAVPERRGEALLRLSAIVQGVGLKNMAPDAAISLVRLLVAMKENTAARNLAVEALAAFDPPPLIH